MPAKYTGPLSVAERRSLTLKKRILNQWNPKVEARAIELLNQDLTTIDVTRTLEKEGLMNIPSSVPEKGGTIPRKDYRGITMIFTELLDDKKLDPSIKELRKGEGTKRLGTELIAEDRKILNHYLESPETFKEKPANRLAKSFNARYNTTISSTSVDRAFDNAVKGNYPELDEHFRGFQPSEFIKGRHINIFPEVKVLHELIQDGLKDGYIMNEKLDVKARMDRLKGEYAKAVGKDPQSPKMENEFLSRMRKIIKRYVGGEERYNKALYKTINAPVKNYTNSTLKPVLIAIASKAGRLSNSDMGEALGLSKENVKLLKQLQQGTTRLAQIYKLPPNPVTGKVSMAGDHTDIKSLMKNYSKYEKEFMRIAYVSEGLNLQKRSYDQKIKALHDKAVAGHIYDTGATSSQYLPVAYDKATGKEAKLYGKRFDPDKHEWRQKKYTHEGLREIYSGPLRPGETQRTIPAAVAKLQKEFFDLSGGYKIGGFDIKTPGALGAENITLQEFSTPRINERASPFAMTIRETLENLKYSEKGGKRITKDFLNVVDQAIISPEGATTKGRMDIVKRFGPEDLKGSGYLQAVRGSGLPAGKSQVITKLFKKGYAEAIKAADINENDICSLLGMKRGGLAGGGCGEQMRKALQEAPDETFSKIAEGPNNRVRNFARQILSKIPKGGRLGAILAGTAAVGAGAVALMPGEAEAAETMTYNSTEGKFVKANGDPETQQGVLNWIADHPIISGLAPIPTLAAIPKPLIIPDVANFLPKGITNLVPAALGDSIPVFKAPGKFFH